MGDPKSNKALSKLNNSLTEVSSIMQKNMDEIIQRWEDLEEVGNKAKTLMYASKEFSGMTRMLSFHPNHDDKVRRTHPDRFGHTSDYICQVLEAISNALCKSHSSPRHDF